MTASSSNSHLLPSSLHSYEAPEIRTIPKTTIKNARNASAPAAMPSSPYNTVSSPPASNGARSGRSRFTYRQLAQLAGYNPSNPLRVIAHIDLDAFYAQCEMIRLGVPENQPLAVQQWQGLIAINYPAREFGIGRHCNVTEAKKLCPSLIAQHVATWREGEDKWAYREDADANIASDKVSLDPYRLQSRKILATIRESLPPGNLQKVEKASIDEVFLDLSAHIRTELLQRFPELSAPPPYDDLNENLPLPSIVALDWKADALVDLDQDQETLDPDWDDVAMLIGSEIVRDVREKVRSELGYTCSAGVASNKLLSKLGSAHKKPNCQTVVRNRAVDKFLEDFKFTKIRNLGGKLGDQVVSTFDTENVKDLLLVSLDQMKSKLGDETGPWLYNTIRGIDHSEVSPRTQIKSMLSAKSFRPSITKTEQAHKWLRIFVADIFARLVEEGVLENKRRPKTMHLSLRHGGQSRSRQGPIVQGRPIDESILLDLAKDLFAQILSEAGSVWPCYNLSLSVGGFEEGIKNNMGIGAFLLKGDEAATLRSQQQQHDSRPASPERPSKRQKAEDSGIQRFFARHGTPDERPDDATPDKEEEEEEKEAENDAAALKCDRCGAKFDALELLQSHADWHMAKDLQDEEDRNSHPAQDSSATARPPQRTLGAAASRRGSVGGTKRGSNQKKEHGQSKLKFG